MHAFRGTLGSSLLGSMLLVAITLLVGSLLITGCTGDEPNPPSPSSTSESPTDTSSPTVTVPAMPEEAKVGDAAGAEAFVRHWIDLLNYAYATGEIGAGQGQSQTPGARRAASIFSVIRHELPRGKTLGRWLH